MPFATVSKLGHFRSLQDAPIPAIDGCENVTEWPSLVIAAA